MEHPRAEAVAGGHPAEAYRDGGLRSRAGLSRYWTPHHALERARGVQSTKGPHAHSVGDRRRHRSAHRRADRSRNCCNRRKSLLQEMQHRVANSLQIIASILMLKARTVESEETRLHLRDAHDRVMSVATVQQHLQASAHGGAIELGPYLSRLCDALAASMIGDSRPISEGRGRRGNGGIRRCGEHRADCYGTRDQCAEARIPKAAASGSEILVRYDVDGANWRLSVSDDGVGLQQDGATVTYRFGDQHRRSACASAQSPASK